MTQNDVRLRRLTRHLRRRLWLARLALAWESLWPALWPAVGVAGLFLALALFDALPRLAPWLHAAVVAGFGLAVAALLVRGLARVSWPDAAQARRRVERDSGLEHRPLLVLDDSIAGESRDPVAHGLWQRHRERALASVRRLRVNWPSPGLPARDRLGLRAAVLLLLVIGGAVGWKDADQRLVRAVAPRLDGLAGEAVLAQVWLTPPGYTGLAPVFLERRGGEPAADDSPILVPAGTAVMALVQGSDTGAALRFGERRAAFTTLGPASQKAEDSLAAGDGLAIEIGGRGFASWPLQVIADAVPSIAFAAPPEGDDRGRLMLAHEADDDFGVAKAWAEVRRVDRPDAPPLVVELPTPSRGADQAGRPVTSRHDLTAHAWAGLPVTMTPVAEDGAGQRGQGDSLTTVLPERSFSHPVARAIIELRRKLTAETREFGPILWELDRIASQPDAFGQDTVVFLALRVARARLQHGLAAGLSADTVDQVRDILWATALRVEEGDRGIAERTLAEAVKALEEALQRDASAEEIDALMDQVQQAMEQYLQALAEEAMRKGLQPMPMDPSAQTITPDELAAMMRQMRDMARLGSREAAQQMLSELRDMLDSLRAGMQGGGANEQMRQAQKALGELGEVAKRQRDLMDQSFRESMRPDGGDAAANRQAGEAQEQLRRRLGEAMRSLGESLGEIPPSLGDAEQAMRDATGQLGNNNPGAAAEAQGQALQSLQQGAEAAMEALAQQMQQGGGGMAGMQNGQGMPNRDPFGRRMRDPLGDDRSVHVPDEAEMHRAREVLDELRRRASQPDRPRIERDYLDRLLRQF